MALLKPETYSQYAHLELLAKQAVEGFITGLHKSPFHGFSVEFAEHRMYNKGESIRHIDWKLFARTEKLFVKRYEEETNLRCQLVIDTSSSMYFPDKKYNKLNFAVECAAVFIQLLKRQRDAVGLTLFSEAINTHTQAKLAPSHLKMLFGELEKIYGPYNPAEHKKTFTAQALHTLAESLHKRSLVIIFSDMFEAHTGQEQQLFAALQHLRHNKHEVILFHVTEKATEEDFGFTNRPYKFIDMESGAEVKVHPSEVRQTYINRISAYRKQLMLRCRQYKIDFIEADISKGFKQVLMPYLVKRIRMQ